MQIKSGINLDEFGSNWVRMDQIKYGTGWRMNMGEIDRLAVMGFFKCVISKCLKYL